MTLTTRQKEYRKYRDEGRKDIRRTESGGVRVTRRAICARVNEEANELLNHWAQHWGWTRWQTLTHLINSGLPKYASLSTSTSATQRYHWDDALLNPETRTVRYKRTTGTAQINERITSTAWNKLQCHSTAINQSKARILQRLILEYTPVPREVLERNRQYSQRWKEYGDEWRRQQQPLTPEQNQQYEEAKAQLWSRYGWQDDEED
jgi:hypothetical protein